VRRDGKVPAVLYGAGKDAVSVSVDPRQVKLILHSKTGHNTIFDLALEGGERTKNSYFHVSEIHSHIDRYHIDRHSYVVAVGGGVPTMRALVNSPTLSVFDAFSGGSSRLRTQFDWSSRRPHRNSKDARVPWRYFSYLKESATLVRNAETVPFSTVKSILVTSAMRRSRMDCAAVSTARLAASSQETLLTPTTSTMR